MPRTGFEPDVEAVLLDDAGEETAQRTLFTAQLWDVDAPDVRPVE